MFSKKSIIVSYTYMLAIPICLMLYAIFPSIRDFVSTISNRNDVSYHFLLERFFQTDATAKRLLEK